MDHNKSTMVMAVTGIIGGALAVIAAVGGLTFGTIESDKQRTIQMEQCLAEGGSFKSGSPTMCNITLVVTQ